MSTRALAMLVGHVLLALAIVAGAVAPADARPKKGAPASIDAVLMTVHATKARKTSSRVGKPPPPIDPRLGRHPAMTRPPLDGYGAYRVMRQGKAILATGMAWKTKLPNGRELMISLERAVAPKKKTDPTRYVIAASLAESGKSSFARVLETEMLAGDTVLIPAEPWRGGLVVVAVKLLAPK